MAHDSPCENVSPVLRIRLYDEKDKFIPDAPFVLTVPNEPEPRIGRADRKGFVRARRLSRTDHCVLRWGPAVGQGAALTLPFQHTINLKFSGDEAVQAERRLNNLGYVGDATLESKLILFKTDHPERFTGAEVNGQLDPKTQQAIRETHDSLPDDTTPAN
jgi:hypothetical protein